MRLPMFMLLPILWSPLIAQEAQTRVTVSGETIRSMKQTVSVTSDSTIKLSLTREDGTAYEHLKPGDITIVRNGNPMEIVRVKPLVESQSVRYNVILCLDNSTSMAIHSDLLVGIIDTLLSYFSAGGSVTTVFFNERLEDAPSSGGITFTMDGAPLKVAVREFGNNFQEVKKYCRSLYKGELQLGTYVLDQVYAAFTAAASRRFKGDDTYIIILSDGEDNASRSDLRAALNAYKQGKVFAVNFSSTRRSSVEDLAAKTNGVFYDARDAADLARRFSQIRNRIIFSGYEITYRENFPPDISSEGFYELVNSQYRSVKKISIEEVTSREFFPLLNYVFFDRNSDSLRMKYAASAAAMGGPDEPFDERNLPPLQLGIYDNILRIVAARMARYPDAALTLVGCNDNDGPERDNRDLSARRARAVRDFLTTRCAIDPSRIAMKAQNLPQKPSAWKNPLGMEENRRVEIYANDERILDPVEVIAVTKVSSPPNLNIALAVKTSAPVDEWELTVLQGTTVLMSAAEKGLPPLYYSWNVAPSLYGKQVDSTDLTVVMRIRDRKGRQSTAAIGTMRVSYVSSERKKAEMRADRTIEKLSLVLFDFNSSTLDQRNQAMLRRIEHYIQATSTVTMNGYTDSIGTDRSNARLSRDRAANSLKELIRLVKPQTPSLSSEGFGELAPLYDNGLPEGRFYNRTCQLVVETPVVRAR